MNKRLRLILISCLIFFFFENSRAQILQPDRIEFKIDEYEDYPTSYSADEEGLFLFRESKEKGGRGMKKWEFTSIDTALNVRYTKLFDIDFDFEMLGYTYNREKMYYLFRDGFAPKDDFVILTVDMFSGDTTHYPLKKLVPFDHLTHFEAVGDIILIGGVVNNRPTLIHSDLPSKKSKVIPGIYKGESEILELKVDKETLTFNVLITEKLRDRRITITMMSFNENGELLFNTKLEPERDNSLIFAGSTPYKDDEIMVTGTYSHKRSTHSRGIFIAKIDRFGGQEIAYYNYADLENFFNYMKSGREERVKKRIERKRIKGKKAKFTYRLLVRDVVEKDGNYVMVGEAFYPSYGSGVASGMDFYNGGSQRFGRENFLGYKFTHAVVVGFNAYGEVLWDNSFEINDVERFTLDPVINLGVKSNKIVLLYLYESEIRSKIITNEELVEGKSSYDLKLSNDGDVIKNTRDEYGGMEKWYGNYFFAYGIQRIKNKNSQLIDNGRTVFFINKITYD